MLLWEKSKRVGIIKMGQEVTFEKMICRLEMSGGGWLIGCRAGRMFQS